MTEMSQCWRALLEAMVVGSREGDGGPALSCQLVIYLMKGMVKLRAMLASDARATQVARLGLPVLSFQRTTNVCQICGIDCTIVVGAK